MKVDGRMFEQYRGRFLRCLSSLLSKSSLQRTYLYRVYRWSQSPDKTTQWRGTERRRLQDQWKRTLVCDFKFLRRDVLGTFFFDILLSSLEWNDLALHVSVVSFICKSLHGHNFMIRDSWFRCYLAVAGHPHCFVIFLFWLPLFDCWLLKKKLFVELPALFTIAFSRDISRWAYSFEFVFWQWVGGGGGGEEWGEGGASHFKTKTQFPNTLVLCSWGNCKRLQLIQGSKKSPWINNIHLK